jgi:hypothetical protein
MVAVSQFLGQFHQVLVTQIPLISLSANFHDVQFLVRVRKSDDYLGEFILDLLDLVAFTGDDSPVESMIDNRVFASRVPSF